MFHKARPPRPEWRNPAWVVALWNSWVGKNKGAGQRRRLQKERRLFVQQSSLNLSDQLFELDHGSGRDVDFAISSLP